MSKSIKLKNNTYIDSTGITHNRELLSNILNTLITELNKLKPVVLYSNDSGTNDTISLTDSIGNYQYIEVFYKTQYNNRIYSNKFYNANGKDTQIFYLEGCETTQSDKNHNSYIFWSYIKFRDSQIQRNDNRHGLTSLDTNYTENGDRVLVTRVLGYK